MAEIAHNSSEHVTPFNGEIEIGFPGDEVDDEILDEFTPEEIAEFERDDEAITEATRPLPGQSEIRLGSVAAREIGERLDEEGRRIVRAERRWRDLRFKHRRGKFNYF